MRHAVGQFDTAFEHAADVDRDVASADQFAAHVDAGRIQQVHALFQQRNGDVQLVAALEFGQLHLAVHAGDFPFGRRVRGHHRHAAGDRLGHDVGQVVLALRIVVLQRAQPAVQVAGRDHHDAAVDFLDRALFRRRILFFDDAHDLAILADDAAQAEGIVLHHGQDRQLVIAGRLDQALQAGAGGQRHVAVQHQGRRVVVDLGQGLHHGVAGAQLGLLQGGIDDDAGLRSPFVNRTRHRCAAVPVNHA
jgi:hypothetical protein